MKATKERIEKKILARYNNLCEQITSLSKEERAKVDRAFEVAYKAHDGVLRKSGEPYIVHPLRVAEILHQKLKMGYVSIICALLHDVAEDTAITLKELTEEFGEEVGTILEGLTKLSAPFSWEKSQQYENFQSLLRSNAKDSRIMLIKLADRLDNMRTVAHFPVTKQWRMASETKEFYIPIAHRLGLNSFRRELSDLWLKTVFKEEYDAIAAKLKRNAKTREADIRSFIALIKKTMKQRKLPCRFEFRVKSISSIYEKIKHKQVNFDDIYDLIAVRIILPSGTPEEEKIRCWQTYGVVTNLFTPNNARKKDWISTPRANGYESLHITVVSRQNAWVEVQIRTERMHEIASFGVAAHWKYKEWEVSPILEKYDQWLQEAAHLAIKEESVHPAIEYLKRGLDRDDEIIVFNGKGQPISLSMGATLLDFAIAELGEEGAYCYGGLANGKVVEYDYVLNSGDKLVVEVDNSQPLSKDVLKKVVTSKAISVLQEQFQEERKEYIDKGKLTLKKALALQKIMLTNKIAVAFQEFLEEKSVEELYAKIGASIITNMDILVKQFLEATQEAWKDNKLVVSAFEKKKHKQKTFWLGKADESTKCERAACCSPIPGEDIFGIMMINGLVKIHAVRCAKRDALMARYGPRLVTAGWYSFPPVEVTLYFQGRLGKDFRKNLLNAISAFEISSLVINVAQGADEEEVSGTIYLRVDHVNKFREVEKIMKKLKGMKGVYRELD